MTDFKVFVNFKTYPQGTGKKAVDLAKICEEVGRKSSLPVIPIVQIADLSKVKEAVNIPIWVQHLDSQPQGQFTGWINLETAMEAGASGTLLNHSEHPIPPGTIKQTLSRVKNFEVMVCCKTLGQMERLVKLKPNLIGFEISELIGGKVSILDHNIKAIKHALKICEKIPLVIGAGIHKKEDLQKAKELGCAGVLISSSIVLADNPKEKLEEILKLVISAQEV